MLTEDITLGSGCVLKFEGGSISGAYTVTGANTGIAAGLVKIFGTDATFAGTWDITEVYPEWFGAKGDGTTNSTTAFQKALDFVAASGTVKIPQGEYLLDTVYFNFYQGVNLEGSGRECTILRMNSYAPVINFSPSHDQPSVNEKCNVGNFSIKPKESGNINNTANVGIFFACARQCRLHDMGFVQNNYAPLYAFIEVHGEFTYGNVIERLYVSARDPDGLNRGGIKYAIKTTAELVGDAVAILDIRNCNFYAIANGEAAIDLSACNQYQVSDCSIESNGNYAVIMGARGMLNNNWFEAQTIAPLLFQNDRGPAGLVSAWNTLLSNVFTSDNPMIIPQWCDKNVILDGNTFFLNGIQKEDNSISINGLKVSEPTITVPSGSVFTALKNTAVEKCGVWKLEYVVQLPAESGSSSGNVVLNLNTTEISSVKSISATAYDIWGNENAKITPVAVRDKEIAMNVVGNNPVMLIVYVEFC